MVIISQLSAPRISTMKVLAVIFVCFACVAARGSGPYLPSGWRPDGPSFYLPSEVAKPLDNPVKEVVFQESEASGSDSLLEYGPPKVQEVSQALSQQGLPDAINEQVFVEAVVSSNVDNSEVLAAVSEQIAEVKSEVQSAIEIAAVTEAVTEEKSAVEEATAQVNSESTTVANAVEEAIEEIAYIAEPTAASVETITNQESVEQSTSGTIDAQEVTQEESEQAVAQEESVAVDSTQAASGQNSAVSSVEISETVTQQAEVTLAAVSSVEEKAQTVEEEVKKVEEAVKNIPEIILNLEEEIKAEQAKTLQEIPTVVSETLGTLEQAPEGFLEYGPPGFREYGPPDSDLRGNTIEENIVAASSEARRRRFSPKFRPSKRQH